MSLCKCFKEVEAKLSEQGLQLADKCFVLSFTDGVKFGIPLQRKDRQKMKRSDPTMLFTARCPFCGKAPTKKAKKGSLL